VAGQEAATASDLVGAATYMVSRLDAREADACLILRRQDAVAAAVIGHILRAAVLVMSTPRVLLAIGFRPARRIVVDAHYSRE
jgi:hypothetical protein